MLGLCISHPISLLVICPQVWHVTGHTSVSLSTGFAPWLVSQPQDSERRGGRESVPPPQHHHDARGAAPCDAALAPGQFHARYKRLRRDPAAWVSYRVPRPIPLRR
jgi:hypothetical protein